MNKIVDLFLAPRRVFTGLKEKPEWVTPFVIVLIILAITVPLVINMTKETTMAAQEEMMRKGGLSDAQIEQALKITQGPLPMIFGVFAAIFGTTLMLLIYAGAINLLSPLFGGRRGFKYTFAVCCFAALIKVPASILRLILMAFTKSIYVATSLALFVPNLAKNSFPYLFLNGIEFFAIWEMILIALGISITNEVKTKNSYILVFLVYLAVLLIGMGLNIALAPKV